MTDRLPIDDVLGAVLEALDERGAVVLRAPTGAGKTTRVAPALLDAGLAGSGRVVLLEPRRLAARAAARRIAAERHVRLGAEVGYHVRFDRVASHQTRLLVVTEGVFSRQLQADPFLEGVGAVLFDEFHERRLDSDLALAMVRRVRDEVRPDLRVGVMSATLDTGPVASWLGGAPVVESAGRSWPVSVSYLERPDPRRSADLAASGVRRVWSQVDGDVLVFLPGLGAIRGTAERLADWARATGATVVELYGDLPPERQDAVLAPADCRRVILSTNVAETSVTLPGVTAVVDSGLANVLRYDAGCGLDRLVLERISAASAEQRAGRAGRTAPGQCLRLWTRAEHSGLTATTTPEVRRIDLAGPALALLAWGEPDPGTFAWLDPPEPAALGLALDLLERLGATQKGGLTPLGRQMAALPLSPRLARVLVEAHRLGVLDEGARLAALLAERDPFHRDQNAVWTSDSDVLDRLEALARLSRGQAARFELRGRAAAERIERAAQQLVREAGPLLGRGGRAPAGSRDALRRALLSGFPDRVARRREGPRPTARGVMVGGRGVCLADESGVRAELFVCVDLEAGRRGRRSEARVRQASAVERDWLAPERVVEETTAHFDEAEARVVAEGCTRYDDLVLEVRRVARPDPATAAALLAEAAASRLETALPLDREDVAGFLARLRWAAEASPELELPSLDVDAWRAELPRLCFGRRSFEELRALTLDELLSGRLSWAQRQELERLAPERLEVPSGSRIALRYEAGRSPILAVRLQELFGLAETPRVGGGRVPVLLHLLAPNYRPQQITDDLASFWRNTYPEVRNELRRRYPRHPWPEDPLQARAVRK